MSETRNVLVFSDNQDLALEILGKAREIADKLQGKVSVLVVGKGVEERAASLAESGADTVFVVDNPGLEHFQAETSLSILYDVVVNSKPEIVLLGSTKNGKPLAARLATKLDVGCVPDCARLTVSDRGKLIGERITYGGNAVAKVTFKTKPQIATVPSRAFEKPEPKEKRGQLIKLEAKVEPSKVEVVETKPLETSNVRIEDASVIVSCGRGLEKKEDKLLLDELASVLDGQVGSSRPLAEDRKWFSEWVGLSGHKVKPKLYIACGISGVIQHVAGIRDSKVIVAINKDEQAPIFEMADYGVVGNLYEILPALKEAIKKQLQQ